MMPVQPTTKNPAQGESLKTWAGYWEKSNSGSYLALLEPNGFTYSTPSGEISKGVNLTQD